MHAKTLHRTCSHFLCTFRKNKTTEKQSHFHSFLYVLHSNFAYLHLQVFFIQSLPVYCGIQLCTSTCCNSNKSIMHIQTQTKSYNFILIKSCFWSSSYPRSVCAASLPFVSVKNVQGVFPCYKLQPAAHTHSHTYRLPDTHLRIHHVFADFACA